MDTNQGKLEQLWRKQSSCKLPYEEVLANINKYRKVQQQTTIFLVVLLVLTLVLFSSAFYFYKESHWQETSGIIVMSFAMLLYAFQHFWVKRNSSTTLGKGSEEDTRDWLEKEKKRLYYLSRMGMNTYITLIALGVGIHLYTSTQGIVGETGQLVVLTFFSGYVMVNYYWNYKVWLRKDQKITHLLQQLLD